MGTRESNQGPLRLSFSGPTAVHDATLAARDFAVSARIDEADQSRLAIVVEELVTNLYDHGGLNADDVFEIELSSSAMTVSFVLVAPGTAFDSGLHILRPEAFSRGGGAGLKLVQAWSRHIDHHYANGKNRLAVVLPFSSREP
jgi:serine/threonine-protein kinase RsbW